MERKRLTAYKVRVKDITEGAYVSQEGFNPNYVLTPYGQKISRVRVLATVLNKFENEDATYAFVVLDDGTETIRVKAFKDLKLLRDLKKGILVDLVGKIREYNDERYIVPEIVKIIEDPNIEILRRLEILKILKEWDKKKKIVIENKGKYGSMEELKAALKKQFGFDEEDVDSILEGLSAEEQASEGEIDTKDDQNVRATILKVIGELDDGKGVEYSAVVENAGLPEEVVEAVLNKLLGEGTCYEPRAGRVKIL